MDKLDLLTLFIIKPFEITLKSDSPWSKTQKHPKNHFKHQKNWKLEKKIGVNNSNTNSQHQFPISRANYKRKKLEIGEKKLGQFPTPISRANYKRKELEIGEKKLGQFLLAPIFVVRTINGA
jgi:hypothetical protein